MNKIDYTFQNFKNLQTLIKFMDEKANAILIITGLILNIYFFTLKNLSFKLSTSISIKNFFIFLFSLLVFLSLLSIFYLLLFKIFFPRKAKKYSFKRNSYFYFEHIALRDKNDFLKEYDELNERKMETDIIEQVYELSIILEKKFKMLSYVLKLLFLSIISLSFLIFTTKI